MTQRHGQSKLLGSLRRDWKVRKRIIKPKNTDLPRLVPQSNNEDSALSFCFPDRLVKTLPGCRAHCRFSHDVTKIKIKKLSILPRFCFHDALEQLKTNCHTNFRFKRVLGFVIEYA